VKQVNFSNFHFTYFNSYSASGFTTRSDIGPARDSTDMP